MIGKTTAARNLDQRRDFSGGPRPMDPARRLTARSLAPLDAVGHVHSPILNSGSREFE